MDAINQGNDNDVIRAGELAKLLSETRVPADHLEKVRMSLAALRNRMQGGSGQRLNRYPHQRTLFERALRALEQQEAENEREKTAEEAHARQAQSGAGQNSNADGQQQGNGQAIGSDRLAADIAETASGTRAPSNPEDLEEEVSVRSGTA